MYEWFYNIWFYGSCVGVLFALFNTLVLDRYNERRWWITTTAMLIALILPYPTTTTKQTQSYDKHWFAPVQFKLWKM